MKTSKKKILAPIIILSILSALAFGVSCGDRKHQKALDKIDSLFVLSDSMDMWLDDIDTIKIVEGRKKFAENWVLIKKEVEAIDDVILIRDSIYWPYITNYETHDRMLKKLYKRYKSLSRQLRFTQNQLNGLKHDIRKDKIQKDSINIYVLDESSSIYFLMKEARIIYSNIGPMSHRLDSLHQYADGAVEHYRDLQNQ